MGVVTFFGSLFTAIANVKALAAYADAFASYVVGWYLQNAKDDQKTALLDAASFWAAASTDEEDFAAVKKFKDAMMIPRVTK